MVRDNVTGLIWEVKTDDNSIHDKDDKYTWYDSNPDTNGGEAGTPMDGTDTEDFINALNSSGFGGFSDWRLPSSTEMCSVLNLGSHSPPTDIRYFPNTVTSGYWSSTTLAGDASRAWHVYSHHGNFNTDSKSRDHYVRAVRGVQSGLQSSLVVNGDGTVTDGSTGLMWEQRTDDGGLSGSSDADNDPLTSSWSFLSVPEGSSAALSDPTADGPACAVDVGGTYVISLVVNDGYADSLADTVTIWKGMSLPT